MRTDIRRRLSAVAVVTTAAVLLLAACGPEEDPMTPEEARDSFVTVTEDTAALVESVAGWSPTGDASATSCGDGVQWSYMVTAPPPDADRLADAKTVADYWKSLGMEVRVQDVTDPVVFATRGPVATISFETGPGSYSISGTSLCVPGDPDSYR